MADDRTFNLPHIEDDIEPAPRSPRFSSDKNAKLSYLYSWLIEEKDKGEMGTYLACSVCKLFGTTTFGRSSLKATATSLRRHAQSDRHKKALHKRAVASSLREQRQRQIEGNERSKGYERSRILANSICGEVNKAVAAGATGEDIFIAFYMVNSFVSTGVNGQKTKGPSMSTPAKIQGHYCGLVNLGNTCYMNATLQCLHSVPELKSALTQYSSPVRSMAVDQPSHSLIVATRELFHELDISFQPVSPVKFLLALRIKYPQFAQCHDGIYMQQDAEECWTHLLSTLSIGLTTSSSSECGDALKNIFGIDLVSRIHCAESGEESSEMESCYSLKCYIPKEVNHLHDGLKYALKSELYKSSPSLGRIAVYTKDSCINDLPRYLTVQFVRFFWDRETNQKIKILRKVDFPLLLDVYDFCSEDLRKRLLRDEDGKKDGLETDESSLTKENYVEMTDAEGSSNAIGDSSVSAPAGEGAPLGKEKHLTGIYDLVAVLTHKGSSADSGHYVAWVKRENAIGKWIQLDDDNPILRREEVITRLSGGDDWHMAYICMYKSPDIT